MENKSYQGSSDKVEEYVSDVRDVEVQQHKDENVFATFQARYAKVDPASYLRKPDESSTHYWVRRLGTIKPVELLAGEYQTSGLRRVLNAFQLIFIGIGAIIGTGEATLSAFVPL